METKIGTLCSGITKKHTGNRLGLEFICVVRFQPGKTQATKCSKFEIIGSYCEQDLKEIFVMKNRRGQSID